MIKYVMNKFNAWWGFTASKITRCTTWTVQVLHAPEPAQEPTKTNVFIAINKPKNPQEH